MSAVERFRAGRGPVGSHAGARIVVGDAVRDAGGLRRAREHQGELGLCDADVVRLQQQQHLGVTERDGLLDGEPGEGLFQLELHVRAGVLELAADLAFEGADDEVVEREPEDVEHRLDGADAAVEVDVVVDEAVVELEGRDRRVQDAVAVAVGHHVQLDARDERRREGIDVAGAPGLVAEELDREVEGVRGVVDRDLRVDLDVQHIRAGGHPRVEDGDGHRHVLDAVRVVHAACALRIALGVERDVAWGECADEAAELVEGLLASDHGDRFVDPLTRGVVLRERRTDEPEHQSSRRRSRTSATGSAR